MNEDVNILELDITNLEDKLSPIYLEYSEYLVKSADFMTKLFSLACNRSILEYDVIYLKLDDIDVIEYQTTFDAYFTQDVNNKNKFKLAHEKAKKLIIVEFKTFNGFDKDK